MYLMRGLCMYFALMAVVSAMSSNRDIKNISKPALPKQPTSLHPSEKEPDANASDMNTQAPHVREKKATKTKHYTPATATANEAVEAAAISPKQEKRHTSKKRKKKKSRNKKTAVLLPEQQVTPKNKEPGINP